MTDSGVCSGAWIAAAAPSAVSEDLARELNLPEPIARLLITRGYADAASATKFLSPSLSHLHDPYAMRGMREAVERIRQALLTHEPILIYGDYDVDGTVATVLLKTACERTAAALGVTPDIRYHIPHRLREGYGMRESRIADAAAEGVRLVVSVDTGIRAHDAAEEAARLGLDLIVTDHHLPDELNGTPRALAVLNPNLAGCEYPCKELCGAAVAFKLAQALLQGPRATTPSMTVCGARRCPHSSSCSQSPPSRTPSRSPTRTAPSHPSACVNFRAPLSPACVL